MDDNGRSRSRSLHIVMLPWAALGHLLPFLELSKRLANRGHRVSYIATPRNIQRLLPTVPPHLSHLIELLPFPLPPVDGLPDSAEATVDLPSDDLRPRLRAAYDTLQHNLHDYLSAHNATVDWLVYDYAAYWAPRVAARSGVPCAYLGLFNAAVLSFNGPPAELLGDGQRKMLPEEFAAVPKWVPFASTIAYRLHEARKLLEPDDADASGVTEAYRFAASIEESRFVAVRSCVEFEPEWLDLLGKLLSKPIVPVGMLPPVLEAEDERGASDSNFKWLDEQEQSSVVYVAFGSEVKLTIEQVRAIALGLELSRLPYLWALRAGAGAIPESIREGTRGRGLVCTGWVPQSRILAHPSVRGFLTHGGWNSIVEGLSLGRAMVVLPLVFDQGLNARNLVERRLAVEVPRDEDDGSFTGEGIADCLRLVMVEAQGEGFRTRARECVDIFGKEDIQDRCLDDFVSYLCGNRNNSEYSEQQSRVI